MNSLKKSISQTIITSFVFALIIAAFAQLVIPLPLVPITGQTLAIGLAATILGSKNGMLTVVLYIIFGAVGLPVFSQLNSGLDAIVGVTGGFLVGFIPAAFLIGLYLEKTTFTVRNAFIANTIGMFVILIIGTSWLKLSTELTWEAAFLGGFAPFIIGGLIKAFLAAWLGILAREKLQKAKLI
tara:strand:+ start:4480 stop:5028 length:549 start_codon:yes stop_codon:yes gene_type:complete